MSDFFNNFNSISNQNNQNNQYNQNNNNLEPKEQIDYFAQAQEEAKQALEQRARNKNRYQIVLYDDEYEYLNEATAKLEDPETARLRIGTAKKISQMYRIPFDEAYSKQDDIQRALYGDIPNDPTIGYKRISDAFQIGMNNVTLGKLGVELMQAELAGDTEKIERLNKEIKLYDDENNFLNQSAPKTWVNEIAQAGAESFPYTMASAVPAILLGLLHPAAGIAAGTLIGGGIAGGQEYIEMRKAGYSPKIAASVSAVSGGIQGLIEQFLGEAGKIAGAATGRTVNKIFSDSVKKSLIQDIQRQFYFKVAGRLATKLTANAGKELGEEVAEEVLQGLVSIGGKAIANKLEGNELEDLKDADGNTIDLNYIWNDVVQNAKGGLYGAIALGGIPGAINTYGTVKQYNNLKAKAKEIHSPEMFANYAMNAKDKSGNKVYENVTEGMSESKAKAFYKDLWREQQNGDIETENAKAQSEVNRSAEGFTKEDEESEEYFNETKEARNEDGDLITQDDRNTEGTSGIYKVGDSSKGEDNLYGFINYNIDEENNTVEIKDFVMNIPQERLRQEFYNKFAEDFAGFNITWETKGDVAKNIKDSIIANNPNGEKAGLTYYSTKESVLDKESLETRKQAIKDIMKVGKELGNDIVLNKTHAAFIVGLTDTYARNNGMTFTDYYYGRLNAKFADVKENAPAYAVENVNREEAKVNAQGKHAKVQGFQVKKDTVRNGESVIYVTENGDRTTLIHELAHTFRENLNAEQLAEAEKVFGVQDHDWINTEITFADGHKESAEEAFARAMEDIVFTGKLSDQFREEVKKNGKFREIMQKFIDFLARYFKAAKQYLNMTPDIENFFNELLKTDGSEFAKALNAVEELDKEEFAEKQKAKKSAEEKAAKEKEERKEVYKEKEEKPKTTETVKNTVKTEEELDAEKKATAREERKQDIQQSIVDTINDTVELSDDDIFYEKQEVEDRPVKNEINQKDLIGLKEVSQEEFSKIVDNLYSQKIDYKSIPNLVLLPNLNNSLKKELNIKGNLFITKQRFLHTNPQRKSIHKNQDFRIEEYKSIPEVIKNATFVLKEVESKYNSFNIVFLDKQDNSKVNCIIFDEDKNGNLLTTIKKIPLQSLRNGIYKIVGTGVEPVISNAIREPSTTLTTSPNMGNDSTESKNVNNINFQILGEKGAKALDTWENVSTRIDNLALAKDMDKAGKDAKTIRLATSWEKGIDGKWRYETDDSNVNFYDEARYPKRHLTEDEEFNKIDKAIKYSGYDFDKINVQDRQYWESVIDSENEYVRQFIDFENGKQTWKKTADLERIIDAPELFAAYPQLRKVQFKIEKLSDGTRGYAQGNTIILDESATRSTLIHEIQHLIQDIEGFARGGTVEEFETKDFSKEKIESLTKKAKGIFDKQDENWKKIVRKYNEASINKDFDTTSKIHEEMENDTAFNEYVQLMSDAIAIQEGISSISYIKTPQEQYNALAGEVEARTVQTRLHMTPLERLNILLSETADVASDEQIVIKNNVLTHACIEKISDILTDEKATLQEKANAVTSVNELKRNAQEMQRLQNVNFQIISEDTIEAMKENSDFAKIASEKLEEAKRYESTNQAPVKIKSLTNWERDNNGKWIYESDDSSYKLQFPVINFLKSNLGKKARLGDILESDELYSIFPMLKDAKIKFANGMGAVISIFNKDGITINKNVKASGKGEYGLKGVLAHEIQHFIQVFEELGAKATEEDIYSRLNDTLSNAGEIGFTESYALSRPEFTKYLLRDNEVEARAVAKRIDYSEGKRQFTLFQDTCNIAKDLGINLQTKVEDDILFEKKVVDEPSMYGIHNLSEDKLRHVLKMGGIANPSLAVLDLNKPGFENFGEISLIPYNFMLEKGEGIKGTFGADIYSPRYPQVENKVTETGERKINSILSVVRDVNKDLGEELAEKIKSRIENANGSLKDYQIEELGLQIPFLAEEGRNDFYKYDESKFSDEILDKYEEYNKGFLSDEKLTELYKMYQTDPEVIKELSDDKGIINRNVLMNLEAMLRRAAENRRKPDLRNTTKAAQEIIEKDPALKEKFKEYAKQKVESIERTERIFNGFTPSGNRRYLAHTLENVSKYMKAEGLQGGENFSYGMGSVRAQVTPKFTSLKQIKKAKDRLVSHDEFENIKNELNEQFENLIDVVKGNNSFDVGEARLEEAFKYGKGNIAGYMEREYNLNLSEQEKKDIQDFAVKLYEMPTEYFEAKYERPVYLNEFAGAVIPSNLDQDLKDALSKAGLILKEYDNADAREDATKQALKDMNESRRVLFETKYDSDDFSDTDVKHEGDFVLTKDGSKDFGEITQEIGKAIRRQAGKIRLEIGFQDDETKKGTGEKHIERKNRLAQLKQFGFDNARDYVEYVSQNFTEIYQGDAGAIILSVPHYDNYAIEYLELRPSKDGDYWSVSSGVVARPNYILNDKKRPLLWQKPGSNGIESEKERAQSNQQKFPRAMITGISDNQSLQQGDEFDNINFQKEHFDNEKVFYDPRSFIPKVRGGWTENKIIKYLKDNPTRYGVKAAIDLIKEFDSPEELKEHMFYHGTANGDKKLKPSITMSDRDIERLGGGGYGQKYWSISVSKSKKVASRFAPTSNYVRIYPIVLAKNAKVIEMPELSDSVELEDHIIDLWNKGIDAVWIGDKNSGEQELSILNPRAVVNIGNPNSYRNYRLGSEENPLDIKDDKQIKEMYEYAKNYEPHSEYDFGKPRKPQIPSRFIFDYTKPAGEIITGENPNYEAELEEYNQKTEDYNKALNDWYNSSDYQEWEKFDRERKNIINFQTVYHGSGANFDQFNTEEYGYSGEGSMSFGYGTYLTDSEEIAKEYAKRQKNKRLQELSDDLPPAEELKKIAANRDMTFEEARQDRINWYTNILNQLEAIEEKDDEINESINLANQKIKEYENANEKDIIGRNLYTVEIPEDGYLEFNKKAGKRIVKKIAEELEKRGYKYLGVPNYLSNAPLTDKILYGISHDVGNIGTNSGTYADLYELIGDILAPSEDRNTENMKASAFFHSIGYVGIKYPAGTIYGNGNGAYNYVIFDDKNAKITDRIKFQKSYNNDDETDVTHSQNFKNWFGDWENDPQNASKVVDEDGKPLVVYHGTYNGKFEVFDKNKANPENDFGKGFYFTSNYDDVSENYEGGGPDFENKVSRLAERLQQEDEDLSYDEAEEKAREQLYVDDNLFEVYLSMKNPVYVGDNETDIVGSLFNDIDISEEDFDSEDEYYEELDNIKADKLEGINQAILSTGYYGAEDAANKVMEFFYNDYGTLAELKESLNDGTIEVTAEDEGYSFATSEIARIVAEELGYDGIIDTSVSEKFKNMNLSSDTTHYIVFNSNQIKSATDNNGEFDIENPNINFQTKEQVYKDALDNETWQDFMTYYETFGADGYNFNPSPKQFEDMAEQGISKESWYKNIWELAHKGTDAGEVNKDYVESKDGNENFLNALKNEPAMLDDFLDKVNYINNIDFNSDEYIPTDAEEAREFDELKENQAYIRNHLKHGTWLSNAKRIGNGGELTERTRKTMLSLIAHNPEDYREIYSRIMQDDTYALSEDEKQERQKIFSLVNPDESIEEKSPEERKKIAEDIKDKVIADKVKNGTIRMDGEIERYISKLDSEIESLNKKLNNLDTQTKEDYARIVDWEHKQLLRKHDELLKLKEEWQFTSDSIARKIDKGLRVTDAMNRKARTQKKNYDEMFRSFTELENSIELTAGIKEALDRQEKYAEFKQKIKDKESEKKAVAQVRKLRKQLVKRTMRNVDFARVDYENAKTICAIQEIFEPNLLGGVNKWIGTEGMYLRGIASQFLTDEDEADKIKKALANKGTKAAINTLRNLNSLKSIADFDKWTKQDRADAYRSLPREDWIKELHLDELSDKRKSTIKLDIGTQTEIKTVYDDVNGKTVTMEFSRPTFSDEIGERVKEALGEDLFNQVVGKPFAEWTTEELEELAIKVNDLYKEGRDILSNKQNARKEEAEKIRRLIESAVRNTGIQINDDDTPEEKEQKLKKIAKILGNDGTFKGFEGSTDNESFFSKINTLLHGYNDTTVRRVARILDNYSESTNVNELYRKADNCYKVKTENKFRRQEQIDKVMKENNITYNELFRELEFEGQKYTVDDLLFVLAASEDYELDENGNNDNYAPTARNAIAFGNLMSSDVDNETKASLSVYLEKEPNSENAIKALQGYIDNANTRFENLVDFANDYFAKEQNQKLLLLKKVIQDDYDNEFERIEKVSIEEFNQPVNRVRKYIPIIRKESNGDTNINKVKQDLLGANGTETGFKAGTDKGFTKNRVRFNPLHQKPIESGLYKTWLEQVDRTEHFIAYSGYVRELNRVYKSKEAQYTRRFIENRYGKGMLKYLDDYINEIANPNTSNVKTALDEYCNILRGKAAPAYLAWKASSIIKQGLTSPAPFMQFVNPATYLSTCFDMMIHKDLYDVVREKSVFMKDRTFDPMIDAIKELMEKEQNKPGYALDKFNEVGMKGIEWIDWVCVAPGWLSCYRQKYNELVEKNEDMYNATKARLEATGKYTSENIDAIAAKAVNDEIENMAVQYADDCTRLCQPSSRKEDLAPLFKNSPAIAKAVLQFQTSLNVIWNNIRYDLPYAVKNQEYKQAVGMVLGYVIAGILMNTVCEGLPTDDDEDKTKLDNLRALLYYSTTQFSESMPVIGQAVSNLSKQVITGEKQFSNGNDIFPMFTKIGQGTQFAIQGNWQKSAKNFAEGLGLATGLPVSGTKELLYMFGIGDGEEDAKLHPLAPIGRRNKDFASVDIEK